MCAAVSKACSADLAAKGELSQEGGVGASLNRQGVQAAALVDHEGGSNWSTRVGLGRRARRGGTLAADVRIVQAIVASVH
jgi:hypothetical protein